ncbi:YkvA family protein [Pelagibacterium montanilacus]|uniref:YkvA family protein n=1 Tax=Pelagibacterium montanilacus TaxID=2185280 RepID=UPI0013DE9B31|nr:YkvA family protein [Pelagibacterium montanilacus]
MLLPRFLRFRRHVVLLAKAFMARETPTHLKVATLFAVLYLISPVDLIPDVIPFAGWLDDLVIVPLIMSLIVARLPQAQPVPVRTDRPVIDGSARHRH